MFNAVQLKRVIDGKSYNTETATLIHEHMTEPVIGAAVVSNHHNLAANPPYQQLYRTRVGKYFLLLRNEPFWNHAIGKEDLHDTIVPIEVERATQWMERHCNEKIEKFMGVPEAEESSTTLTLRMDKTLKRALNLRANLNDISMNSWCIQGLEHALLSAKPMFPTPANAFITKAGQRVLTDDGQPGMAGIKGMASTPIEMIQTGLAALIYQNCQGINDYKLNQIIAILSICKTVSPSELMFDEFIDWVSLCKRSTYSSSKLIQWSDVKGIFSK